MDSNQVISELKQILETPTTDGQVDVEKIHAVLGNLEGKQYLELAQAAFQKQLESRGQMASNPYKAIFGIVTSYAREDPSLTQEDWKKLQSDINSAVSAHNNKHPQDKLDWNNLPPDLAAGKTMVFTILNRNLLGGITQKLGSVFGTASPSGGRGAQTPSSKVRN